MTEIRSLSGEVLADVLERFAALTWPVAAAAVPGIIADLGWSVDIAEADFVYAGTGWPITNPRVLFSMPKGNLATVSFELMDVVQDASTDRADTINDVFARVVEIGNRRFGRAAAARAKLRRSARWDLGNGGQITVSTDEAGAAAHVYSAEYAEAKRVLARR